MQTAKHLNLKIYGRVHGVFYRFSAKERAEQLGLCGFVRNEKDGSVYIEVEGQEDKLDEFLQWAAKGPPLARVTKIDPAGGDVKGYKDFRITI